MLVALAAIPCVWLSWKLETKRRERAFIAAIHKKGGYAWYDWQVTRNENPAPFERFVDDKKAQPGTPWICKLLGDDFFANVKVVSFWGVSEADDTDVVQLTRFRELACLDLHGTRVTNVGLMYLTSLTRLRDLSVNDTEVTDAGVAKLQEALPKCKIVR
jgi:hypothetical protein